MIRAYPYPASFVSGNPLYLCIATPAPQFRIDLFRQQEQLVPIVQIPFQSTAPGAHADPEAPIAGREPWEDWGWQRYRIDLPFGLLSGVYLAVLYEGDGQGRDLPNVTDPTTTFGFDSKALFIIRSANPASTTTVLYKVPLFTYHAYNFTGYHSFYNGWPVSGRNTASLLRPGGGTGGLFTFYDLGGNRSGNTDADFYDNQAFPPAKGLPVRSLRQSFSHWDALFIAWLYSKKIRVDFCADIDIDGDPSLLDPYCLLITVGHDEYWTARLRRNVERYLRRGGNLAVFSGNTCWWRIELNGAQISLIKQEPDCAGNVPDPTLSDHWWTRSFYDSEFGPENSFLGVSYRNGNGRWTGEREAVGYKVQNPGHWIYDGLKPGGEFGAQQHLIGYECDGAAVKLEMGTFQATGEDGTPADFEVLGVANVTNGPNVMFSWESNDPREGCGIRAPNGAEIKVVRDPDRFATMGLLSVRDDQGRPAGLVFNAATTDWARVLAMHEPTVAGITENVVRRLSCSTIAILGPEPGICGHPLAGAGDTAKFRILPGPLALLRNPSYRWRVDGAMPNVLDQAAITVKLPQTATPVRLHVDVFEAGVRVFVGTTTVVPLLPEERWIVLERCAVLRLGRDSLVARRLLPGVRDRFERVFVDPLWDPLKDGGGRALSILEPEQIKLLLDTARELTQILQAAPLRRASMGGAVGRVISPVRSTVASLQAHSGQFMPVVAAGGTAAVIQAGGATSTSSSGTTSQPVSVVSAAQSGASEQVTQGKGGGGSDGRFANAVHVLSNATETRA